MKLKEKCKNIMHLKRFEKSVEAMNQNEIRNLEDIMDYESYEGLEFLNES